MDQSVELFKYAYAGVKYLVGLNKTKPTKIIRYLLILLTATFITVICLLILPAYLFHLIIDVYLKLKYRERYGGMLTGLDYAVEVLKKPVAINLVGILSNVDSYQEFEDRILKEAKDVFQDSCWKFSQEIETIFGYKYYLKSEATFEDNVSIMDNMSLSKEYVMEYVNDNFMCCDSLLGKKAYRVFINKQPIVWNSNAQKAQYLVIITVRHSIGDGIALASMLVNKVEGFVWPEMLNKFKQTPIQPKKNIAMDDAYIYSNPFATNCAFPINESNNYLAFYNEECVNYVSKIKSIKNKLGVGFSDVISAASGAAIYNYGKKNHQDVTSFKIAHMMRPMSLDLIKMIEGTFDYNRISNNLVAFVCETGPHLTSKSLPNIAVGCHKEGREVLGAVDLPLLWLLSKVFHLLSSSIAGFLADRSLSLPNIGITNVAGLKSAGLGKYKIECMFPFVTDSFRTGFKLSLWTISDKLQVCLTGPKAHLKKRSDLSNLLMDTLKNIDQMYNEIYIQETKM